MGAEDHLGIGGVTLTHLLKPKDRHASHIYKRKGLKEKAHDVLAHLIREGLGLYAKKQAEEAVDLGQGREGLEVRRRVKSRCEHAELQLVGNETSEFHEIAADHDKAVGEECVET